MSRVYTIKHIGCQGMANAVLGVTTVQTGQGSVARLIA